MMVVVALQVCSDAVRFERTSKEPLMVAPETTQSVKTRVTPFRSSVALLPAQAGAAVLGVIVTWPGQTLSPRASASTTEATVARTVVAPLPPAPPVPVVPAPPAAPAAPFPPAPPLAPA